MIYNQFKQSYINLNNFYGNEKNSNKRVRGSNSRINSGTYIYIKLIVMCNSMLSISRNYVQIRQPRFQIRLLISTHFFSYDRKLSLRLLRHNHRILRVYVSQERYNRLLHGAPYSLNSIHLSNSNLYVCSRFK